MHNELDISKALRRYTAWQSHNRAAHWTVKKLDASWKWSVFFVFFLRMTLTEEMYGEGVTLVSPGAVQHAPLWEKKKECWRSLHEAGEYTRLLFLFLQSQRKDCVKPARQLWIDCPLGNTLALHTKVLILFLHSKLLWCPTEKHRLQLLSRCLVWRMVVMSWGFFFF